MRRATTPNHLHAEVGYPPPSPNQPGTLRHVQHEFWQERWQEGRIGFHQAQPNSNLTTHVGALGAPGGRVLVPLCGKTHDLTWLEENGFDVVGCEFVADAVNAYFAERGLEPTATPFGDLPGLAHGGVSIAIGDFFKLAPRHVGRMDAVYDRAALVAIAPERRSAYVQKLAELAAPGAGLLLVNFEHDMGSGPPFSIATAELANLFKGQFSLELISDVDILAPDSPFRERGATFMREQVFVGNKLERP